MHELAADARCPILVVDDEEAIRTLLMDVLEDEGYNVFGAEHGRAALDLLHQIPRPRLILVDLMMPVMNGIDFRRALLADPRLADIPVVILSAGRKVKEVEELKLFAYLSGPPALPQLLDIAARACA